MESSDVVKIVAIAGLVVIEIANLFTSKYDGTLVGSISAIIGGIAGYQFGRKSTLGKK
ncbi:MAG: hypothetical protein ACP5HH_07165 [Fervidicoccaceae archaeon]